MRGKEIVLAVLLVGVAVMAQGCVVAAVGAGAAGTVAYIRGDLEATEARSINAVYKAAKDAAEQMGLMVTKEAKDALTAKIIARDAEDKKVTISLKRVTDSTTKLSIRVGLFGDETKASVIYQKIHDNLK